MSSAVELAKRTGVFPLGGPGTYVIEGKSGSGKNHLLGYLLHLAKNHIYPSNIVTYSGTSEETDSFDVLEQLYPDRVERWTKAANIEEIVFLIEYRKTLIGKMKQNQTREEVSQWLQDNPMLVIADDIGGVTATSNSNKNPWFHLVTTVRHWGIYAIILVQYQKQLGPAFTGNTRAVISFDRSEAALKHFAACTGMNLQKNDITGLQVFLREPHTFLVWWQSWVAEERFSIKQSMPDYPWLVHPVDARANTLNIEEINE